MAISAILFDLDGTLLPMKQDTYAAAYIKGVAAAAAPHGYEPKGFSRAVMSGIAAMVKNNGSKTNEAAFWDSLADTYGEIVKRHMRMFDEFYEVDFQKIKDVCGFAPRAAELIQFVKEMGYRVVLATNPIFPSVATESRIRWAGLKPEDFEIYTTYENSHYCKPSLDYYEEIMKQLNIYPEECLMVGNNVEEDMIAESLGMKVFLLTDCLINEQDADISAYPHGNFDDLFRFINALSLK